MCVYVCVCVCVCERERERGVGKEGGRERMRERERGREIEIERERERVGGIYNYSFYVSGCPEMGGMACVSFTNTQPPNLIGRNSMHR